MYFKDAAIVIFKRFLHLIIKYFTKIELHFCQVIQSPTCPSKSVWRRSYLDMPSRQLAVDVQQIIWNDVEQTCCQENPSGKTADQTQNRVVGFCKV